MVHWENVISINVGTAPLKIRTKYESNLATESSQTWEVTHNLGSVSICSSNILWIYALYHQSGHLKYQNLVKSRDRQVRSLEVKHSAVCVK